MVDQILSYLEEGRVEPLIVIAPFFKPSRWNDKTSVQSHFGYSNLRINPDLEEVNEFCNRRLSEKPSNSTRITQVSSHDPRSDVDKLKHADVEEGPIWIAGTIVSINAEKDDWFKVEVMVYNGTRSIMLFMWDRETIQLCGRQADQIKDEECTDGKGYPPTLDCMMDRRLLFKVNVKASNIRHYDQVYTVMKICDDEEIETDYSDSLDVFAAAVNLHNDTEFMLSVDGLEDNVTSLKSKTPAKRAPIGLKHKLAINLDKEDVGFSTNKFSRKEGKRQKMQSHESYK
ncbi:uncharacterized protein LOC110276908 [Arachis duranensis]|uniref:Uncharacterized protein LOC110276908 n=1 Tax=Arachis duranensis TaxID=130453 RepID=A0A6P5MX30_ARADU|nr:uncharacterized protein LOC110276908 [Arachis duranensis]